MLMLILSLFVISDVNQDIEAVLKKVENRYAEGSMSADMEGAMEMNQMGMAMKMSYTGQVIRLDETHMRTTMNMDMDMGQQKMQNNMLIVWDGTTSWIENQMMGQTMVIKGTIEEIKGSNQSRFDMGKMVESLKEMADWESMKEEGDMVILKGKVKAEKASENPMLAQATDITVSLHKNDVLPMTVEYTNAEKSIMKVVMKNPKPLTDEQKSEAFYQYTPPEGVMVMDFKDMPQMQ